MKFVLLLQNPWKKGRSLNYHYLTSFAKNSDRLAGRSPAGIFFKIVIAVMLPGIPATPALV
jgi:hypothetical protein